MKFLSKNPDSNILLQDLKYSKNAENNKKLLELLKLEQNNFCAYTEKYLKGLDNVHVEHFDSSLKNTSSDGYYNYYAVLAVANLYKKDEKYKNAFFFESLFFQNKEQLDLRIRYTKDGLYEEIDFEDKEAIDFIDFLGLNDNRLFNDRVAQIKRLKDIFEKAKYSKNEILDYFKRHKDELSFVTAIEVELEIDLEEVIKS
jgi:hypothetical protein